MTTGCVHFIRSSVNNLLCSKRSILGTSSSVRHVHHLPACHALLHTCPTAAATPVRSSASYGVLPGTFFAGSKVILCDTATVRVMPSRNPNQISSNIHE